MLLVSKYCSVLGGAPGIEPTVKLHTTLDTNANGVGGIMGTKTESFVIVLFSFLLFVDVMVMDIYMREREREGDSFRQQI